MLDIAMKSALLLSILLSGSAFSQKRDTVVLSSVDLNMNALTPGVHRWLVYGKKGADSPRTNLQIWTREIILTTYKGKDVFAVNQTWENDDTIFHTARTYCDRKTFQTYFQESWLIRTPSIKFEFMEKQMFVNNQLITGEDTSVAKNIIYAAFQESLEKYFFNWHLDLEIFSLLPYKDNTTFLITFYDPGFAPPRQVPYSVVGSDILRTYDNQKLDCWLLSKNEKGSNEMFWISKKTREVLKLEQGFNGRFRYKIKLGFSS